jgi:hypothetical protein
MCGSGLVDAVAQLVSAGLLDHSGRFVPDEAAAEAHPGLAPRLVKVGEERVFVLAWRGDDPANAIYLSQRDVRELQFAKASIATGWHILLSELGVERLAGDHCYDVFAGDDVRRAMAEEPGTYFLTDFLARTFDRTVWRSLGLDRHPDLRDAYFKNYTRVVYLTQRPTPELRAAAARAAQMLGLPLEEREVGEGGLEQRLEELVEGVHA